MKKNFSVATGSTSSRACADFVFSQRPAGKLLFLKLSLLFLFIILDLIFTLQLLFPELLIS